jgi:hypothetical protein
MERSTEEQTASTRCYKRVYTYQTPAKNYKGDSTKPSETAKQTNKYKNKQKTKRQLTMVVFWVAAPCSLVEVYRRSRDACCLHHKDARHTHRPDDGRSKHL